MKDKDRIKDLEAKLAAAEAELEQLKPKEQYYELSDSVRRALIDYMGNAPSGTIPGKVPMQLVGVLQNLKPISSSRDILTEDDLSPKPRKLNGAEDPMRSSLRAAREARA